MAKNKVPKILYQETLLSKVNIGGFTIAILVLLYAMFIHGDATPGIFTYGLLVFFLVAMINFGKLSVLITTGGIIVGYGFFKQALTWDQIESCAIDPIPGVGWLIQMNTYQGKQRIGYHVFGKPKIKLEAKGVWFSELTFSTGYPHQVMEILTKGESKRSRK